MRRSLTLTLTACCLLGCVRSMPTARAADFIFSGNFETPRWVAGYFVGYEQGEYPIDEVDFSSITHLMIGRERPLAGGALSSDYDLDAAKGPAFAHAAVNAAHAAKRKAVLMIGGAGEIDGWEDAANTAHRAAFVSKILTDVDSYGYDGVDLDWEPLDPPDYANFLALAQALRTERPGLLLSVPIIWANTNFDSPAHPDAFWAQVAPWFDRVYVMTYDMAGAWEGWQSWHNSALYGETASTPSSVSSSVTYYLAAGIPAEKLGVGIAFYGDCWKVVTAPHQINGTLSSSDGAMSYVNIVTDYYSAGVAQWDATARVPYLSSAAPLGPKQCNFVTYENAASIAEKAALVRSKGLGGTIIWTISQGHLPAQPIGQRDPLLDAVRKGFLE